MKDIKKLSVVMIPIGEITPYEANAKKHDKEQVAKIVKSIQEFGWDTPIVVDVDGVIIKGHGRRLAAISMGYKEVPVIVRADLNPEQVKAARLADNRVAMGDYDSKLLQQELESLSIDMSGIFDDKELDFMSVDIGTMSDDAFIEDINSEVSAQQKEVETQIKETSERKVSVVDALGFKLISASDELYISRFITHISEELKLPADEAFAQFAKQMLEEV